MADQTRGFHEKQRVAIASDLAGPFRIGSIPHIAIEVPAAANALTIIVQTRDDSGVLVDATSITQATGRIRGLTVAEDLVVSALDEIWLKFSATSASGGIVRIHQRST